VTDLDDAVRNLARLDASSGFAATVRARVDADAPAAARWPRLAVGAAAVAAAALVVWFVGARPGSPIAEVASKPTSPTEAPQARTQPLAADPGAFAAVAAIPRSSVSAGRRARRPAVRPPMDHERALAALELPGALEVPDIDPPPLGVAAMAIQPLEPPSELTVPDLPAGGAGPGDR